MFAAVAIVRTCFPNWPLSTDDEMICLNSSLCGDPCKCTAHSRDMGDDDDLNK